MPSSVAAAGVTGECAFPANVTGAPRDGEEAVLGLEETDGEALAALLQCGDSSEITTDAHAAVGVGEGGLDSGGTPPPPFSAQPTNLVGRRLEPGQDLDLRGDQEQRWVKRIHLSMPPLGRGQERLLRR